MLYGYAINVMGKSIEKIDCGSGLSNLSDVKNQKNEGGTYNKCGKRQILKNLQRWIKRFFERWFS